MLTHWGRVTHICVSELTIIGSDNGLSPGRRQAIIWTNDGMLLIGPLGTNFSDILCVIQTFSFNKMHLKMSSAKWRPFCLGLNVLSIKYGPFPLTCKMMARGRSQHRFRPDLYDQQCLIMERGLSATRYHLGSVVAMETVWCKMVLIPTG